MPLILCRLCVELQYLETLDLINYIKMNFFFLNISQCGQEKNLYFLYDLHYIVIGQH